VTAGIGEARESGRAAAGATVKPVPVSLRSAAREALSDIYFNSWRLAPANVAWGLALIAVVVLAVLWLPAIGLVAVLALPTVGIYRMAAIVVRGDGLQFADFGSGIAKFWRPAIAIGAGSLGLGVVFTVNAIIGLRAEGLGGWLFGVLALYGDIGLAMMLTAFWPILVDPQRADRSVRDCLRLALLVNLARPARMAAVTIFLTAILLVSTVFFAVLLTAAIAYSSLVATRIVLPIADRIEGRPIGDPAA
jgi:hypothetical protein